MNPELPADVALFYLAGLAVVLVDSLIKGAQGLVELDTGRALRIILWPVLGVWLIVVLLILAYSAVELWWRLR